jgi:hypothetical protein
MKEVTRILAGIQQGDPHAAEQLLPLVYEELRKLAAARLAQEKPGQTLQATALVHEAYLRLVDVEQARHWNSRGHFFAAAAGPLNGAASTVGKSYTTRPSLLPAMSQRCWPSTTCWIASPPSIPWRPTC